MKILITGAGGFLGRSLVAHFSGGHTVLKAVSFPVDGISAKDQWLSDVEKQVSEFRPDAVIMAGASQRQDDTPEAIAELLFCNVEVPSRIAKRLTIVNPSGMLVVFGSHFQVAEDGRYQPFSFYAASKQAGEAALGHFALAGLRVAAVRLFDVFGEGDTRKKLLNALIDASATGAEISVSPGQQEVDLIHVKDVARGVSMILQEMAAHDPAKGVKVYGLGSGMPMKVVDLISTVEEQAGRKINAKVGGRPYRDREIMKVWKNWPRPAGWEPQLSPYGQA